MAHTDSAENLRAAGLAASGDAVELSAFEWPLHPSRWKCPTLAQWARINPSRPQRTTPDRDFPMPRRPSLPAQWERYVGERERPFARLLRDSPLPGESRERAGRRVHKVRQYLGGVGSYTATSHRRARELTRRERLPHGGIEWRIVLTGYAERTGQHQQERTAIGTQAGAWQRLAPGETVSCNELTKAYYDVARAATRTKTDKSASHTTGNITDGAHGPEQDVSTIYDGDSDESVIFPTSVAIEYRQA